MAYKLFPSDECDHKAVIRHLVKDLDEIDPEELTTFEWKFLQMTVENPPPKPKKPLVPSHLEEGD